MARNSYRQTRQTRKQQCSHCGGTEFGKDNRTVFCDPCLQPGAMPDHLSDERYLVALERILNQIQNGLELNYYDDDTPGNKSMHCSWGLCSARVEQWPDAIDHTWKHSFETQGRFGPLYRQEHQLCPFDRDLGVPDDGKSKSGCFHRCRIFKANPRRGKPIPTREEAIALYQQAIELAKARLAATDPNAENAPEPGLP